MFNFLTFLEVSRVNNNLEAMQEENRQHRYKREIEELNNDISKLFSDLYQNNNDISKVKLDNVKRINNLINQQFNTIKNSKPRRNYIAIVISLVLAFITYSIYSKSGWNALSIIFAGLTAYICYPIYQQEKFIKEYKKHVKENKSDPMFLKNSYRNLSAYGLYFKWYLETQCSDIVKILHKEAKESDYQKKSPFDTLKAMYKIFELKETIHFVDAEIYILNHFNAELFEIYDSITKNDINNYNKERIRYRLKNNLENEEEFIKGINQNYSVTVMNSSVVIQDTISGKNLVIDEEGLNPAFTIPSMTKEDEDKILHYFFDDA